jgi:hypothetical protein
MAEASGRFRRFLERFKITSTLAGIGAVSGALAAVALTFLGNIISGYPIKPGLAVYSWNVRAFAVLGAVFGPPLAWSMLRRVPLWRTLTEPAVAGVIGAVITMMTAPALFPLIVPGVIVASAWRLNYAYRDHHRLSELHAPMDEQNHVARGSS